MAAQVYSASLMAIEVDTAAERSYLDGLARAMGLSPQTAQNIEQLMGMAQARQKKRQGAGERTPSELSLQTLLSLSRICWVRSLKRYKSSVLDKVLKRLQHERLLRMKLEAGSLASSRVKIHPDRTGAKKGGPQSIGKFQGG